jgi:hypothetical protein
MRWLRKFINLTPGDRLLLVRTLLLLGAVRLGLKLLPFQTLRSLLASFSQPTAKLQMSDPTYVDRVVWAVRVASRYVRGVRCLAQALATQVLLEQRGYPTDLRIGFTRSKGGQMSAHAWVESEGRVVIGGSNSPSYYILVPVSLIK